MKSLKTTAPILFCFFLLQAHALRLEPISQYVMGVLSEKQVEMIEENKENKENKEDTDPSFLAVKPFAEQLKEAVQLAEDQDVKILDSVEEITEETTTVSEAISLQEDLVNDIFAMNLELIFPEEPTENTELQTEEIKNEPSFIQQAETTTQDIAGLKADSIEITEVQDTLLEMTEEKVQSETLERDEPPTEETEVLKLANTIEEIAAPVETAAIERVAEGATDKVESQATTEESIEETSNTEILAQIETTQIPEQPKETPVKASVEAPAEATAEAPAETVVQKVPDTEPVGNAKDHQRSLFARIYHAFFD